MVDSTTDATGSDAAEPFRVRSIVVRESAMSSGHPYDLVSDVVDFVNFCAGQAAIAPEEMPQNAMRSYYTDYYHAQVNNGGHGQFVGNSNWTPRFNTYIREGLKAFGDEKFCDVFEDLCALMESDPERAQIIMDGRGFGDIPPEVKELDSRFFALEPDENLLPAHASWLRDLPEIRAVSDEDYENALQDTALSNPHQSERKRKSKRQAITLTTKDRLQTVANLLCQRAGLSAPNPTRFGKPCSIAPDGREATAWQLVVESEDYVIFLFDDVAVLCEAYLRDGRRLTQELKATQRENLFDIDSKEAKEEYRELARLPMDLLNDAIEQANSQPLLQLADILLRKAPIKGEISDIFAVASKAHNRIFWEVRVEGHPTLYMTVHPNPTRLYDHGFRGLIDLSANDIEYAFVKVHTDQEMESRSAKTAFGLTDEHFVKFLVVWARLFAQSGAVAAILIASVLSEGISAIALSVIFTLLALYLFYRIHRARNVSKTVLKHADEFPDLSWLKRQVSLKMIAGLTGAGALGALAYVYTSFGIDYFLRAAIETKHWPGELRLVSLSITFIALYIGVSKVDEWLHHWAKQRVKSRPR